MLFTTIYINNKRVLVTNDIPVEWYNNADISSFYNYVCEKFPTNDWKDIVCDNVKKVDDNLEMYFTTY